MLLHLSDLSPDPLQVCTKSFTRGVLRRACGCDHHAIAPRFAQRLLLHALPPPQLGIDERVEVAAVEHALDVARLHTRSTVLDPPVIQHIVANLTTEAHGLRIAYHFPQFRIAL